MKILALESASLPASAALLSDEIVTAEFTTNFKITHSETLLPMVDEILKITQTDKKSIDAIAISEGPGSFTGLRIGASAGKGLAFALGVPVIPVPTLDAMAYGLFGSGSILCPIMDARRSQVYTGLYSFENGVFTRHMESSAISIEEQVKKAEELSEKLNKPLLYLGDGVPVYEKVVRSLCTKEVQFAPAHVRYQRAANVAALGKVLFESGVVTDAENFLPVYLRKSQAEREREEMLAKEAGVQQ